MINITKRLITAQELKQKIAVTDKLSLLREKRLDEIRAILSQNDRRLLLIIGPCSADSEKAFYEYLSLLKGIEKEVNNKVLIVPRLYTAKPRSKGDSYKGILYSGHPSQEVIDLQEGLITARRMFVTALKDYGFVCADELLHTDTYDYFDDIASYAVIGARNSESQQHRFLASGLDIPTAFKNPISGNIEALCNAVYTAQKSNSFISGGYQVQTSGNAYAHAILRGGVDRSGNHFPNYSIADLQKLQNGFSSAGISNPAVIIDSNHSNSAKNYQNQAKIVLDSFGEIRKNEAIRKIFVGYMIESYILDGACDWNNYQIGRSVTDGCLGWESTKTLVYRLCELL